MSRAISNALQQLNQLLKRVGESLGDEATKNPYCYSLATARW